jgi:hypothetical protein
VDPAVEANLLVERPTLPLGGDDDAHLLVRLPAAAAIARKLSPLKRLQDHSPHRLVGGINPPSHPMDHRKAIR